ncbi:MAG: diacylglycerol kinase family protein [Candidatus Magasanikbacteria bacterium]
MKLLVVYNPVSGKRKLRDTKKIIEKKLSAMNYFFDWFETQKTDMQPFEQYNFNAYDRILAVGGDGTVHQVVDYLLKHNIKKPLAIIPQGTGNLLAQTLDIPLFPIEKSVEFALNKDAKPVDVMYINDTHYALTAVGVGYDSLFMKLTTRTLKRKLGFFAYIFVFLKTFFVYHNNIFSLVIDGERQQCTAKSIMVFNALTPLAKMSDKNISPCDGMLSIAVLNPHSLWDLLHIGFHYIFKRTIDKAPKIKVFNGIDISINPKRESNLQIDGEVIQGKYMRIKMLPKALDIVYTKKFSK